MSCQCYVTFDLALAFVFVLTFEHQSLGLGLGLEHPSLGLGLACQGLGLGLELLSLESKPATILKLFTSSVLILIWKSIIRYAKRAVPKFSVNKFYSGSWQ